MFFNPVFTHLIKNILNIPRQAIPLSFVHHNEKVGGISHPIAVGNIFDYLSLLPPFLNRALGHLPRLIPDFFVWWDPINKVNNPFAAPYSDTRFPVHAALEILRLTLSAQAQSKKTRPAAEKIVMISNANDTTVSNSAIASFTHIWDSYNKGLITAFQFEKSLSLPHDLIRPDRSDARVDIVYPKLMELIK